jgi:predicted transcriptional regulator
MMESIKMTVSSDQFTNGFNMSRQKVDYTTRRLYRLHKERRVVISGFPIEAPLDMATIGSYYDGDEIQCLLCGKFYQSLAGHLSRVHMTSPTEYKLKYKLPMRRGLVSARVSQSLSDVREMDTVEVKRNREDMLLSVRKDLKGIKLKDREKTHYLQATLTARHKAVAERTAAKWDAIIPDLLLKYDGSIGFFKFLNNNGVWSSAWKSYKERHQVETPRLNATPALPRQSHPEPRIAD